MAGLGKVAVVGAGSVGAAVAYASMIDRVADEIALYDIDGPKARAEVLDLRHGLQFVGEGGSPVVTTSRCVPAPTWWSSPRAPSRTRARPAWSWRAPTWTWSAGRSPRSSRWPRRPSCCWSPTRSTSSRSSPRRSAGLPHDRVIGSGTVLDTSRLRNLLAERLGIAVNSVHATVVGEHGDTGIVLWSSATVGGSPLLEVVGPDGGRVTAGDLDDLLHRVRNAAYEIIVGKGATNLAIGLATARIVGSISRDERTVLPVSVRTEFDGIGEVCLSLPSVVGRRGVVAQLPVSMTEAEQEGLRASAATIRSVIDSVV